jgi:UDP-N-acetyl-D-mannosaminuronate dehydrogenase
MKKGAIVVCESTVYPGNRDVSPVWNANRHEMEETSLLAIPRTH